MHLNRKNFPQNCYGSSILKFNGSKKEQEDSEVVTLLIFKHQPLPCHFWCKVMKNSYLNNHNNACYTDLI